MEKEGKQTNKHVKVETKQKQKTKKIGFLGNGIMHAKTGMHTHNQAYVHKLDHVYANPCPENLKKQKQSKILKQQF